MQTREQKILAALSTIPEDPKRCEQLRKDSKLRQLPSLLLRHGPVQVVVYLQSKGNDGGDAPDQVLLDLYLTVLHHVLNGMGRTSPLLDLRAGVPVSNDNFRQFAGQPLADRLADQALCVEVANWLNRSIEGRYQDGKASKEAQ